MKRIYFLVCHVYFAPLPCVHEVDAADDQK